MSPALTSHGIVLAAAMAVSAVIFDLLREKYFPPTSQIPQPLPLKSCLSSGSKKTGRERSKKKKKKVKFAEDVKDRKGNGEMYRKEEGVKWDEDEIQESRCGDEIGGRQKMPGNRAALYAGILNDRVTRIDYY